MIAALKKLKVGDALEMGKLFPGLDEEKIVWGLTGISENENSQVCETTYTFDLTWYGVPLGEAIVEVGENGSFKVTQK